jgi:hypothetical protein
MHSNWKHIQTLFEGTPFAINGLNIWDCDWQNTGQKVNVKDPLYGQTHTLSVFRISDQDSVVTFAAGEFSNGVWGIYQQL